MDPADLDDLLDRELKRLPGPRAPATLLPRVMAAARAQGAAGPRPTGWTTWSLARRLATLAGLLLVGSLAGLLIAAPPQPLVDAARAAESAAVVSRMVWDVLLQPVARYLVVVTLLFTLACAGAWAAMELALGGSSQR